MVSETHVETGKIRFRTLHFAPTALVQNGHAEFPLKDWNLEPSGINRAVLTLSGQINDIKILIGEGEIQVIGLHEALVEEFEGWHPVSILFKRLSQIGLNFIGPTSMNGVRLGSECLMKVVSANQVSRRRTRLYSRHWTPIIGLFHSKISEQRVTDDIQMCI
jgi:hypothetical protein